MKILLTGHKGFIGSRLKHILEKEHIVYGLDITEDNDINTCDLNYSVDLVIHLAGKSGVRQSIDNPQLYWYNNVEGSRRIFKEFKDTRIIYASSSSAYEPHLNPYAASKLLLEYMAKEHDNNVGIRIHTTYSDVPRKEMFFDKLLNGKLEYATKHYRDFIHLEDVCSAIICIINNTLLKGVIDIGTGKSVYIPSLAPNLTLKEHTPHERQITKANITMLNSLGFKPEYTLEKFLLSNNKDIKPKYLEDD